ncbi:MAG: NAD(+)/NADH kinase [Dehalococcoidia bacterium]|nr:MAG: NAD(+)/NADH kinase [Dehalococcoidia bacterium]
MKRIGIVYHPLNKGALDLARKVAGILGSVDVNCWSCSAWEGQQLSKQVTDTDLILTVGGDGTILRTAQALVSYSIPIIGINMGKLGFLTELTASEAVDKLPALLAGGGWIDERAMLEVRLESRQKKRDQKFLVLNDVVIARGEIARIIYIEAEIDDEPLTTYKADGVIVATATGSTGYALACGGPILHPQAVQFLLAPIVPHLSLNNTLVLPSETKVKLRVGPIHKAVLSVDGHISIPLDSNESITVKHSRLATRFLRTSTRDSFYSMLERKLKG